MLPFVLSLLPTIGINIDYGLVAKENKANPGDRPMDVCGDGKGHGIPYLSVVDQGNLAPRLGFVPRIGLINNVEACTHITALDLENVACYGLPRFEGLGQFIGVQGGIAMCIVGVVCYRKHMTAILGVPD